MKLSTSHLLIFFRLQLVKSEYAQLDEAVDGLGRAINSTLGRQKEALTLTHNNELRQVETIVETLNKEKTRLEESILTNERACELETQRDWYKKEALHLDECLEKTKARQKELIDRLEESEADRKWMKIQLEKLTESNRMLEQKFKELGVDVSDLQLQEEEEVGDQAKDNSAVVDLVTEKEEPNTI